MEKKQGFFESELTLAWLSQFQPHDQKLAQELLEAMLLVSRDEFAEQLNEMVAHRIDEGDGPIGLYAEREIKKWNGEPNRLFKESRSKVKRAFGAGPKPITPTKAYAPEVGSEGLVAQMITEICREKPLNVFNHPGPDKIRERHIRRFIVVADFIGSGQRTRDYLTAAWRLSSTRSWSSFHLLKFEVIAYAATKKGQQFVTMHPSKPSVHIVKSCPTVFSAFKKDDLDQIQHLCVSYDPVDKDPVKSLGYKGGGALIAFAHGVPNNAPRIFYKSSKDWAPLFPFRVTTGSRQKFGTPEGEEAAKNRLIRIRQNRLAEGSWLGNSNQQAQSLIMVLATLGRGKKIDAAIAEKTGLTILDVNRILRFAIDVGWIDSNRRLTELGQKELHHARGKRQSKKPLPVEVQEFYYPSVLRVPRKVSS